MRLLLDRHCYRHQLLLVARHLQQALLYHQQHACLLSLLLRLLLPQLLLATPGVTG